MRASKARSGPEPGRRVTGAGAHTAKSKGEEGGEVHLALHHIDPNLLEEAFYELKVDAARAWMG